MADKDKAKGGAAAGKGDGKGGEDGKDDKPEEPEEGCCDKFAKCIVITCQVQKNQLLLKNFDS